MAGLRNVGNLATLLLQQHLRDKAAEKDDQRAYAIRSLMEDQSAQNNLTQQQQQYALAGNNQATLAAINDPTGGIAQRLGKTALVPSQSQRQAPLLDEASKADSFDKLMSPEDFRARVAAQPGGINSLPEFVSGLNTLNEQKGKIQGQNIFNDQRAAQQAQDKTFNEHLGASNAAAQTAPQDVNTFNTIDKGTRDSKAATAGAEANSRTANDYHYDTFNDKDGNTHIYETNRFGAHEVGGLPTGMSDKANPANRPLTAAQVDNLASLNTAETEGVKVLQTMKALGLDKSNDMLTPRADAFAIQTLKIAPAEWARADAVQRLNYVRGAVLRTMMGARPSQYIAEIFANHVPDQIQSGQQLYHTMHNVLEQVGARRQEIESLTNRQPGSLNPVSGMTYTQWIDANGADNPTGDTMGEHGDPDIMNFMNRPVQK